MLKNESLRVELKPRNAHQAEQIESLHHNDITFAIGPAGTGKTYVSTLYAIQLFEEGEIDKIYIARPAVTAGERLGFLPGDLQEKLDPFLIPIYEALNERWQNEVLEKMIADGELEIGSIGHMRGRSFKRTFLILDECQNLNYAQTKMAITRFGKGCKMIITGDPEQIDLQPRDGLSGLMPWVTMLEGTKGIGVVEYDESDVVRHPIVARILKREKAHLKKLEESNGE